MNFLSVCSGIEAASVAWQPLGWKAWGFSEIEPFPCSVLAHHYPDVPNLGDMTKFKEWPDAALDLLCGGTPCQSFSVAGLRAGLADPRGNLMLTYLAIAAKYRPKWVVWENVPGVLSSWSGDEPPSDLEEGQEWEAVETSDFGSFLAGLGELGYGYAYRVLDAQFFGVPQRRRRVFVVGCLGDWHAAAAVLFERHSLSGHPAPRREAGERPTGTLSARTEGGGGLGSDFECAGGVVATLDASYDRLQGASGQDANHGHSHLIPERARALTTSNQRIDAETETETFIVSQTLAGGARRRGGYSHDDVPMVAHSLRGEGFDASEDGTGRGTPLVPIHVGGGSFPTVDDEGGAPTLTGRNGDQSAVVLGMQVRRLTPRECERLQGFPDDYTLIPHRGKPSADGPRYKALGNSWAVPCARWIGRRIQAVDAITNKQLEAA